MVKKNLLLSGIAFLFAFASANAFATSASGVTGLSCINQNGQTFCTYIEPTGDPGWANYRYDLYESTSGPITNLSSATLVESGLFDNGGQLNSTAGYDQTTRQDRNQPMSRITNGGAHVPFGTGIAVRTTLANRTAYYAVITRDATGAVGNSTISLGSNSLATGIVETNGAISPVLQFASSQDGTGQLNQIPSNTTGMPMWLRLHASGGDMSAVGDYWALWGDSTMGYQDGIQQVATIHFDKSSLGQPVLIATPQDRVWVTTGATSIETYWNGYDWRGNVQQPTENWLDVMLPFLVMHYNLDVNRIYGDGRSMGGLGQTHWGIRQVVQPFAAVFARVPVWRIPNVTSMTMATAGKTSTIIAPNEMVAGKGTTYSQDVDSPTWVSNCNNPAPPVLWSSGRMDTTFPRFSMWTGAVAAVNAMEACHRAFAFAWNNGDHSTGGAAADQLYDQYQTSYVRNISYPAFTGFSLDNNPEDGTINQAGPVNGDLEGCINCGWSWNIDVDTPTQWSVDISNSQITSTATTNITARNTQSFLLNPGDTVTWSATGNQSGTITVDQYGLATISNLILGTGTTTVTMSSSSPVTSQTNPTTGHATLRF